MSSGDGESRIAAFWKGLAVLEESLREAGLLEEPEEARPTLVLVKGGQDAERVDWRATVSALHGAQPDN